MAGLSTREREEITERSAKAIAGYLAQFPWQHVFVLTVANVPGTNRPRMSARGFVTYGYPRFIRTLKSRLGRNIQDFWVLESGLRFGRTHMNVFLAGDVEIPRQLILATWHEIAGSWTWQDEYDPAMGPRYWIKELTSLQANVFDYGGSVVYRNPPRVLPDKTRGRKSDHRPKHRRLSYRAQGLSFA